MRFQTDDIIKDTSGTLLKVQGILGNKVLTGDFWNDMNTARDNKSLDSIFTEADLAECTIVERDGKPYEPERWVPKDDDIHYYPDPESTRRIGSSCRPIDSQSTASF